MSDKDIEVYEKLERVYSEIFVINKNKFSFFFSPGRINLIGEHTDYTGGLIYAAGIDCGTYILAQHNDLSVVNVASVNFENKIISIDLNKKLERGENWSDYLKGILIELRSKGIECKSGFNCVVYGDISHGAGLSSSASLEMAVIMLFLGMNNLKIPLPGTKEMINYALLAQKSENDFIGVKCGIMDQFVIGNAKEHHAIKLDCFDLTYEYCPLKLENYILLVVDTNKKRRLEESKYNERISECKKGFLFLKENGFDNEALGRISVEDWKKMELILSDYPVIKNRLEHVVMENNRVKLAFDAIKRKDIITFARLLNESGDSLSKLYEVTGYHLDVLVEAARTTEGVLCSRMMGAGFGGCTVNIINKELINDVIISIKEKYRSKTGIIPSSYIFELGKGAGEVEI